LNTNGNVLILRGIYYELWKILSNPISLDEIMKKMESSNFNAERINEAIHLLQEKGIVIENTSFDIDIY
jgi:deoxyhypusine synthase